MADQSIDNKPKINPDLESTNVDQINSPFYSPQGSTAADLVSLMGAVSKRGEFGPSYNQIGEQLRSLVIDSAWDNPGDAARFNKVRDALIRQAYASNPAISPESTNSAANTEIQISSKPIKIALLPEALVKGGSAEDKANLKAYNEAAITANSFNFDIDLDSLNPKDTKLADRLSQFQNEARLNMGEKESSYQPSEQEIARSILGLMMAGRGGPMGMTKAIKALLSLKLENPDTTADNATTGHAIGGNSLKLPGVGKNGAVRTLDQKDAGDEHIKSKAADMGTDSN